jgi:hypothetical protein
VFHFAKSAFNPGATSPLLDDCWALWKASNSGNSFIGGISGNLFCLAESLFAYQVPNAVPAWNQPDRCYKLGLNSEWRNCVVECTGRPMSAILYPGTAEWTRADACGRACAAKQISRCWWAAGGHGPSQRVANEASQTISAHRARETSATESERKHSKSVGYPN